MTDPTNAIQVAHGISDYGAMAMMSAFYLILSAGLMITCFKWFKSVINQILDENRKHWETASQENQTQTQLMIEISEGLRVETQLRIRNLSGFAFDLAVEQVCRIIKNVREQNHIVDHEATDLKVRRLLHNIYEDRKSRFDPFVYHGKPLSTYCNPQWIDQVATVVEAELYNENGQDNPRAFNNVKMAYDDIKIDFYKRINE